MIIALNNPYKYVDRNGNWSLFKAIGNVVDKVVKTVKKVVKKVVKNVTNFFNKTVVPYIPKPIKDAVNTTVKAVTNVVKVITGKGSNSTSKKGGGSSSKKAKQTRQLKNVSVEAKCPERDTALDGALNILQNILDWIGWLSGNGDICDGINAVISFCRGLYLDCAISVACLALPVVADSIFKPLKKVIKSASDFATKAIEKLSKAGHKPSKIVSGITSFCGHVKSFVKSCWLIPSKVKNSVCGFIDNAKNYVKNLFEKAKNALAPQMVTPEGIKVSSNAGKDTVQEITNSGLSNTVKVSTKKITEIAQSLGFKKTNYFSNGQAVYKKGNKYITYDVDRHNGGFWKMADSVENLRSKKTRLGTYDINLNRIGD